ncbi:hypothetical protein HDU91_000776 [Kappamyces sp. JEL0680]|nr:hypothetical protein HDU91_000776 [Kappamyces sp. JEL0680]
MSKSLKNFLTIKETLEQISPAQFRLMFLLHSWDGNLDYSIQSVSEAKAFQTTIQNFLSYVQALNQEEQYGTIVEEGRHNYGPLEAGLVKLLGDKQTSVRAALCDNFNTPLAMQELKLLITLSNTYHSEKQKAKVRSNSSVLSMVAAYVTKMMRIFGVFDQDPSPIGSFPVHGGSEGTTSRESMLPVLQTMSAFRDQVRVLAQAKAEPKEILQLCDKLRDDDLVEHGIVLEDRDGSGALVKLVDKQILKEQRAEKLAKEEAKKKDKEQRAAAELAKKMERLLKGKTPPGDLFRTKEYSEWDDKGLPTKDSEGQEVTKSKRKKLEKEMAAQAKLHKEYLDSK